MSYFPNARIGENGYSDKDLRGTSKAYLAGYDQAVADILNLEYSIDEYSDESLVMHYLEKHPEEAKELFVCIKVWAELSRNECAISLLDEQAAEDNNDI